MFYNHWPLDRRDSASTPGSFRKLPLSKIKTFESRQPDNPLSAALPDLQISPPQLFPLAFPFPSSPARVVFSLSPASLRHKEASRREDLQHDSKTLSPVAMIHRELESRPNITTLLCPAIHANEFPVVLIRNVTQTILSNMNSYAKYKLCQIQVPKVGVSCIFLYLKPQRISFISKVRKKQIQKPKCQQRRSPPKFHLVLNCVEHYQFLDFV